MDHFSFKETQAMVTAYERYMTGIQELYSFPHRPLEGLASGNQAGAAGPLINYSCSDCLGRIIPA